MSRFALLLASTMLAAQPAAAQEPVEAHQEPAPPEDHLHETMQQDIVVTGSFVRDLNILAGTDVLSGAELVRDMRPQLGDTLARQPGVSATSFTPGASRPVLRGFQGERVRVLVDGIGSIDVSNTSADHAVTVDPLTAERIEVLHGPAVLLFGSQAIGGAVNVYDRRIPRRVPDEAAHVDAIGAYGSAADEYGAGAGIDVPLADGALVAHVDGSYRNTGDVRVGGFVLSPAARAERLEIAAEEEAEGHAAEAAEARGLAGLRGRLPGSFTETVTAGAGLALIRDGGSLGLSVGLYDSRYGVPSRPGAVHAGGAEEEGGDGEDAAVSIDLRQIRADLRSEVDLGEGFLDLLRLRLGYADYEHVEFEGEEVGTRFLTEGLEGRLELVQRERAGWRGVIGGQFFTRDLSAVGAEAFLPPNSVEQFGIFTLQELERGPLELEAAARYEHSETRAPTARLGRGFDTVSAAFGASYEVAPLVRVGANLSRAQRAPSPEELFSNGPHAATQAFEIGDPGLDVETSLGGELYARAQLDDHQLTATFYYNRFDDFVFEAATGEGQDGLPVFRYFQADATHWGFEAGGQATIVHGDRFHILVDGVADYVRATIRGGGPVPRIPPLRLLGGIEAQSDAIDGRIEIERSFAQHRVAGGEEPTDGFTLVNASLTFRPWGRRNPSAIILSAANIFDVDARRHASFTKAFVPLAGRDLRLAARLSF